MRTLLAVLALALGAAGTAPPAAAQGGSPTPDLRGTWVGTTESLVRGPVPHAPPDAAGEPRLVSIEITYTIDGQDGGRFWGSVASARHREPLVGVVGFDGRSLHMQDADGTILAALVNPDTLQVIYQQAGPSMDAARFVLTRRR
jgi:hypothetical protein